MSATIKLAQSEIEAWKKAHREAMECVDHEGFAQFGLDLLKLIQHEDRKWVQSIEAGKSGAAAEGPFIGRPYEQWLETMERVIGKLSGYAAAGYDVPVLLDVRKAATQVRANLALAGGAKPTGTTLSAEAVRASIQNRI